MGPVTALEYHERGPEEQREICRYGKRLRTNSCRALEPSIKNPPLPSAESLEPPLMVRQHNRFTVKIMQRISFAADF